MQEGCVNEKKRLSVWNLGKGSPKLPKESQIAGVSMSGKKASSLVNVIVLIHWADCLLVEMNMLQYNNLVTSSRWDHPLRFCSGFMLTKEALITCAHVGFLQEEKSELESMNIPNPHHLTNGHPTCTPHLQDVLQAPIHESLTNSRHTDQTGFVTFTS